MEGTRVIIGRYEDAAGISASTASTGVVEDYAGGKKYKGVFRGGFFKGGWGYEKSKLDSSTPIPFRIVQNHKPITKGNPVPHLNSYSGTKIPTRSRYSN